MADETKTIRKKMSRADVKLKELEQQLQSAQDHFNYIKKRLTRMKNVCEERGLIRSKGFVNLSPNSSNCVISFIQESNCSSINDYQTSLNTLNSKENFHEDTKNCCSYISQTNSTKSMVINNNDAGLAVHGNDFQTKEYVGGNRKPSVANMITKVLSDEHLNNQHNNEEKMSISTDELSNSSYHLDHSNDLKLQEIFKPFPPTSTSDKKSQLILKINAAQKETCEQYKIKESDKMKKKLSHTNLIINEQPQLNQIPEYNRPIVTTNTKKMKLKKSSIDRSESKNRAFINLEKNRKKYKRRGVLLNRRGTNSLRSKNKNLEKMKILKQCDPVPDVVELYHNTAAENATPSVESSKHYIKSQTKTNHEDIEQNPSSSKFNQNDVSNSNLTNLNFTNAPEEEFHQLDLNGQLIEASLQDSFSRKKERPDELQAENHHHPHNNYESRPLCSHGCRLFSTARNYQQPTIASKLKTIEKGCVRTKDDIENIPFINGTSLSRSHNIGLNVQQTVSSWNTKQHQISADFEFEPINNTGKTSSSVIQSLLDTLDVNSNNYSTNSIIQSKSLVYSNAIKEVDNVTAEVEQPNKPVEIEQSQQPVTHNIKNLSANMKLTKSKNSLSNYQNFSSSGKFENTMHKIYDRLNVLNKKYEYLQNQLLKTNDEKIKKQLTQVENQLHEKEEEINAIASLCCEVAALKRQIKMQHSNSLLYITTKCSTHDSAKINASITTRPQQNCHSLHITQYQQRKSQKMPAAAKVFAGLLRNIQSIQHQLTTI